MVNYKLFTYKEAKGSLVLLPGLGRGLDSFDHVVREMVDEYFSSNSHYNVLVIDSRCDRDSTFDSNKPSITAYAENLDCVLEHVGMMNPVIVGDCFGGVIALEYAHLYPGYVDRVGIINPVFDHPDYLVNGIGFTDQITPHLELLTTIETARKNKRNFSLALLFQVFLGLPQYLLSSTSLPNLSDDVKALQEHGLPDYLDSLEVPVHLMYSDNDELVHSRLADYLLRTIPKFTRVEIESAKHVVLERNRVAINLALRHLMMHQHPRKT